MSIGKLSWLSPSLNSCCFLHLLVLTVSLSTASEAWACRIGETRNNVSIPEVTVTAPARTAKWNKFWARGLYTAPAGYAIANFNYRITSRYEPSHLSWSWVSSPNTNYASQQQISAIYHDAINLAAKYKKYGLEAKLKSDSKSLIELSGEVGSNRSAVEIHLMRKAAGLFREKRTVTVHPSVDLLCIGTPTQIQNRVDQTLGSF